MDLGSGNGGFLNLQFMAQPQSKSDHGLASKICSRTVEQYEPVDLGPIYSCLFLENKLLGPKLVGTCIWINSFQNAMLCTGYVTHTCSQLFRCMRGRQS